MARTRQRLDGDFEVRAGLDGAHVIDELVGQVALHRAHGYRGDQQGDHGEEREHRYDQFGPQRPGGRPQDRAARVRHTRLGQLSWQA